MSEESPDNRQAGVEVTPEMIQAGKRAVDYYCFDPDGSDEWDMEKIAVAIYQAMDNARRSHQGKSF